MGGRVDESVICGYVIVKKGERVAGRRTGIRGWEGQAISVKEHTIIRMWNDSEARFGRKIVESSDSPKLGSY
jgi:hypothetical protein